MNQAECVELLKIATPIAAFWLENVTSDGCFVQAGDSCEHGCYAMICSREPMVPALCGRKVRISRRSKHEKSCPDCKYEARNQTRRLTGGYTQ